MQDDTYFDALAAFFLELKNVPSTISLKAPLACTT
jgi:hypothetical protein